MLKSEVVEVLNSIGIRASAEILEEPPQEEFGDIAFPCFELAKTEKRNPQTIAEEIAKKIKISKYPLILKVEARGGYVNLFFYWEKIAERVLRNILSKRKIDVGKGKRIMVEYSTPNPVHPIHIGHARTTFLGDAIANTFNYLGYRTIRANYMNDVGLQVAKLVTAYNLWGKNKRPVGKSDMWLWQYYVKFHDELVKYTSLDDMARDTLKKFEIEKDKNTVRIWNKIVEWCVKGFKETYKKLGVNFDVYFYESDFRESGKDIVDTLVRKNIAFKSPEGAIVADLEKYGIPNTVVLRSDGTGLYLTSDLSLTVHKFEKYKLDKAIWVVMSQQNLHFKQLFKTLELLGYEWVRNCYHFSYEPVQLAEGKMSSREGKAVMLDEVVNSLIKMAYSEVEKRNPKMSKREKKKIAERIGISALKYAIVRIEPENSITFNWDQMLSFEGNTGPYIQYAYTRCTSILKKARKWRPHYFVGRISPKEKQLTKILLKFFDALESSTQELKPHHICNYVYDLATVFNSFYQVCPVLQAEEKQRNFRLVLVEATRIILEDSMKLIGMEVVEKM